MKQKTLLKTMLLLCALIVGYGSAWGQVTIWSENFDGLAANATPTAPTNTAYTGVIYTCTDGTGTSPGSTKIMNEKLAGGASAPEMMVGKKGSGDGAAGGKFTAVIPLDNFEGTLTLTYYQNKQTLNVRSTTAGVSGGQSIKPSEAGQQTTTFTGITKSMTSITICFESTTTNNVRLDDIVLTGYKASSVATPTFSPAEGTYTSTQNVTISCTTTGTTIYYTTDGSTPTSSSTQYSGAIAVNSTTTIKAIAIKGNESSSVASATYTILEHAGTAEDPYTVADAINAIDANSGITNVYVTGIVCTGGSSLSSGALNYWISDDGTETNKLEAYKGKNLNNTDFTATTNVKVGDVVTIYGTLTKYNTTYEFTQGNYLVEHKPKPATPTFDPVAGTYTSVQTVSISTTTEDATIHYTTDGSEPTTSSTTFFLPIYVGSDITIKAIAIKDGVISDVATAIYKIDTTPFVLVSSNSIQATDAEKEDKITVTYGNLTDVIADVNFYESDGTTAATYDHSWIATDFDENNNLEYVIGENTVNVARTAYLKIYAIGNEGEAESELITITQAAAPYASLPFSWNNTTTPVGITNNGVGTYSSSPYLKFDGTGDYIILKFNETPGTLAFDIKGNSFSGGTFKVQASTNGETYTDLVTYTDLGSSTETKTINNLGTDVRYIKWIYVTKDEGNVALGNINLYDDVRVTLAASGYASFCSPLPLDLTPTDNYAAYVVTQVNKEVPTVMFEKITGAVPAETPFILYGTANTTATLQIATGATTAPENNMLIGTLVPTEITTVDGSFTNFGLSGGQFVKMNNGTIPANKAYLPVPTSFVTSSAPALTIVFGDDETTGIGATLNDSVNDNVIYDLSGRHVAQPTKGIYIMNGKKVVIK